MLLFQSLNDFALLLLCFATLFPIVLLMFILMHSSVRIKVCALWILLLYEVIIIRFWIFIIL